MSSLFPTSSMCTVIPTKNCPHYLWKKNSLPLNYMRTLLSHYPECCSALNQLCSIEIRTISSYPPWNWNVSHISPSIKPSLSSQNSYNTADDSLAQPPSRMKPTVQFMSIRDTLNVRDRFGTLSTYSGNIIKVRVRCSP